MERGQEIWVCPKYVELKRFARFQVLLAKGGSAEQLVAKT